MENLYEDDSMPIKLVDIGEEIQNDPVEFQLQEGELG